MDCICSDEGTRAARFTMSCSGETLASFDTTDEVHAYVRQHPNTSYTILLGQDVSLDDPEVKEMKKYWRWWEPAEKAEKFERLLADEWAVEREDEYMRGIIVAPDRMHVMLPVRPETAMKAMRVGETELLKLLRSGRLPPPKKLDEKRVAWRWDEILAMSEWLKEQRA